MRTWFGLLLLVLVVLGVLPSRAAAWGKEGHEIVGKIADKNLTSKAQTEIALLLQGDQFQSLSDGRLTNWADSIRNSSTYRHKYPNNDKFHFIDIEITEDAPTSAQLDKNFKNKDCALSALLKFQAILKDPSRTTQERREALFFIAHIIGDIHQPLHCATRNNDRGGNLCRVTVPGDPQHVSNLHRVWDTNLVQEAMGSLTLTDYANRLALTLSTDKRKEYQAGTLEDWILGSNKIARTRVYMDQGDTIPGGSSVTDLSSNYLLDNAAVVEEQLTRGGVRLAQFLNDTFKD
jgi:hypothetical protein